jgi:hypothetical protein
MTLAITTARSKGKDSKARLVEAEQILSDKINGMPVSQIMEKYSCSRQTVYNRIDAAVDARVTPTVDRYREMMNAAYEEQMVSVLRHKAAALVLIEQGTTAEDSKVLMQGMAEHARALEMIGRTREAQRKLNGLDMPARAEVSVVHHDAKDLELAEMVRQAKSRDHTPA